MTKSKRNLLIAVVAAAAVAAAVVGVLSVCRRGGEPEAPADPVAARMSDPVYVAQLDGQNARRKAILHEMRLAQEALNRAKAANADPAEIARLEGEVKARIEDFKRNRLDTERLIRARMISDSETDKLQKKGN